MTFPFLNQNNDDVNLKCLSFAFKSEGLLQIELESLSRKEFCES